MESLIPASGPRRVAERTAPVAGPLAVAIALATFAGVLAWHAGGGEEVRWSWAPSLGVELRFALDGLGALYAILATGIGAIVFAYATAYLPRHLDHQNRSMADAWPFFGWLVAFMLSMVGMAAAQDLLLLFVFFDITAVASYFLVGYDRHELTSRSAALMALLLTGATATLFLVAVVLLWAQTGTWGVPESMAGATGSTATVAGALIAVAGLAKCAQAPLHFWLPRAMAAPTPVSAYLHSAALVAAGVFLLGRFSPLLVKTPVLLDVLVAVGALSILVGGVLALWADDLKQILAYSTISQYGYVVILLGWGGASGALAASLYVLAHGLAKSALFLVAGAVTEATGGEKKLSRLGGLWRSLPVLAIAGAVCAASLSALPLTLGFFKDELLFVAALERSPVAIAGVVAAAGVTLAYTARLWVGIFLGPVRTPARTLPVLMVGPVVLLAILTVISGLLPGPFEELAAQAGEATAGVEVTGKAAYHLDLRSENLMALGAWTLGLLVFLGRGRLAAALAWSAETGRRYGSEALYAGGLRGLNRLSDATHRWEVRDLRSRIASVLVPAAVLATIALIATPSDVYTVGELTADDVPLAIVSLLFAAAAIAATLPRDHLMLVLVVSASGLALVAAYAAFGAADVALVAAAVEIVFALLFVGIFARLPRDVLKREARLKISRRRGRRNVMVGVGAGLLAFVVTWAALSAPTPERSVAQDHIELVDEAHAYDVVTAILADFRGLDTFVEIMVVAVAFLGVGSLLRRRWT